MNDSDYDYKCDAIAHFDRCRGLLSEASDVSSVFYAALELRFCIERLCFEYLVLLTHRNRKLSKTELKLYEPKAVFKRIIDEFPHFEKAVGFINAVFESDGVDMRMAVPDIDWLQTVHGRLGNYLHSQKEPPDKEKLRAVVDLVSSTVTNLAPLLAVRASISNMSETTQSIYDKYVECQGKIEMSGF